MKIIQTNEEYLREYNAKLEEKKKFFEEYNARRAKATEGCDTCPCCGETKTQDEYLDPGNRNNKIVRVTMVDTEPLGFFSFKKKIMHFYIYECMNCHAKWRSELFDSGERF